MTSPTMAATGAAISPITRSLSLDRLISASISSTGRISCDFFSFGSSSGRTMEYFRRSQRVIRGASSAPGSSAAGLEGIGEGYRSPGVAPFGPAASTAAEAVSGGPREAARTGSGQRGAAGPPGH